MVSKQGSTAFVLCSLLYIVQRRAVRISQGGVVSKLDRLTDQLMQPKFVGLSRAIKSKNILLFYCKSHISLNNLYFETDCTHLETD